MTACTLQFEVYFPGNAVSACNILKKCAIRRKSDDICHVGNLILIRLVQQFFANSLSTYFVWEHKFAGASNFYEPGRYFQ
jgi:hypothetical protein